ncbi:E3 ubiquitin-protein ligase PRT6 [Babesia sp. Xinjiang]|uniref:E3 ubiquitin-protein ligase PRT6 n=1 Tax=Babesia sp. Xinjiang TaxID=462227 RepID=UPI000A223039|nr:E3 ubiquitin-protein ligase PRT6 [Babesia sp. Xinjiang]ORM41444.1 E3 ubiquitin-protein ligase PRT6 [Babesia sp. Xinjiang]
MSGYMCVENRLKMTQSGSGKRERDTYGITTLNIRMLGEKYCGNYDRDAIFREIYTYLYPKGNPLKVNQLIDNYIGATGHCTTKWMEETVAFKCYDCESDNTCAICLDCFFRSNHEGHRYRLTRTSGGCCDCGDNGSWDIRGSCYKHSSSLTLEDERQLLNAFSEEFCSRLMELLRQIIEEVSTYVCHLDVMQEQFIFLLMMFLDEILKVTPAFRYAFFEVMSDTQLKLWIRKHHQLPVDIRKTFNSLYLTMVTSMSFKMLFSNVYTELYADVIEPLEETDEWHLSHLSVQLFTYPDIATRAIAGGFIDVCMKSLTNYHSRDINLDTLQFPRFDRSLFGLYLVVLSDFSYLMAHEAVVKLIFQEPELYTALFNLLRDMNMMNTIEMATHEHVSFENTGYSIAFTSEHTLHTALRQFSYYCKSDVRAASGLYKAINDYVLKYLTKWRFNSNKLCRTFHIPFVRFFTTIINFNHVRELYASGAAAHELRDDPIVTTFDDEVLIYVLRATVSTLRFSQEIKHNLWVYNGESMHDQNEYYRQVVLVQMDVAALQIAVALLGLRRIAGLNNIDVLLVLHKEAFGLDLRKAYEQEISIHNGPGDMIFRAIFFMHLLCILLHDVKHLEKLSVIRNAKNPELIRRGYPLLIMDVVTALSVGRLDFAEVTGSVDIYWRHHPDIVKAVETVATVNYSELSDKAYLRPKSESYRLIDIMWNPHNTTSDISLPQEVTNRGNIGLLGAPRSDEFMEPEYYQTQDAIMNAIGSSNCFTVVWQFLESLSGLNQTVADPDCGFSQETLFYDAQEQEHIDQEPNNEPIRYFAGVDWSGNIGCKWNDSILAALKTINVLLETREHINDQNASRLVDALEAIARRVGDDKVMNTALQRVIQQIREKFQINPKRAESTSGESRMQYIKKLQKRYMAHILAEQSKVSFDELDLTPSKSAGSGNTELDICILCKQGSDDDNRMSFMCLISTNSVMRRCAKSVTGPTVYAKASLPLKSSMISCCGHMVHTKCITNHNKSQCSIRLMTFGVQKANNEFFCPICKALCNYTLEYVPDAMTLERCKTHHMNKTQRLCSTGWRYSFCANWIPSPIYARFNLNPHVMYMFNVVLPLNDLKRTSNEGRSFLEDLGIGDSQESEFSCNKCLETNLAVDYQPKCSALFYPKGIKDAVLDRRHIIQQLKSWLSSRPTKRRELSNLLKVDLGYTFSREMTTEYCRMVFGGKRCLYGIQNWRHVNAGVLLDSKFWMFYHYLLATCTCRRNQLTLRPSLLQHLVRNMYNSGMNDALGDCNNDVYQLDRNYFDLPPGDLVVPKSTPRTNGPATTLTILVESMSDKQLCKLAEALDIDVVETVEPTLEYMNVDINDKFGLDVTSSWSMDLLREFLLFFIQQSPTKEKSLEYLGKCVGMLLMQVLERVVLADIKRSFAAFIDMEARGGNDGPSDRNYTYSKLKFKRQLLSKLYEAYLKESIDSAEIPSDLLGRVNWVGFAEHEDEFKRYNSTNVNEVFMKGVIPNGSQTYGSLNEPCKDVAPAEPSVDVGYLANMERQIGLAREMQETHHRIVSTFIHPVPEKPTGDIGEQARKYLYNLVTTLLKTRHIHALVESGVDDLEFNSILQVLGNDVEYQDNMSSVDTWDEEDTLAEMIFSNKACHSPQTVHSNTEPERYYLGMDLLRRLNEQTYRAHCNFALFEVLRHLVPEERHLFDFISENILDQMSGISNGGDILHIARMLAERVYNSARDRGYLRYDFEPDIDAFVDALLQQLNVLLDISFWTIFSVFETREDIVTKVSYAHLHHDSVRFKLLAEVTGVNSFSETILKTCMAMLGPEERMKLELVRATGHETMAPLVSGYNYVDMQSNLPADVWELVQRTTKRSCPTCGETPANPLICLLCGSVVCYQGKCCDRNKGTRVLHMLITLERNNVAFRPTDLTHIYTDELVAHTSSCGGGQCVYISPYNCFLLLMDDRRRCITHTLYSDTYGNKDLHGSVYGPVMLSHTRLNNIKNTFCQGRLAHEIINAQKEVIQ